MPDTPFRTPHDEWFEAAIRDLYDLDPNNGRRWLTRILATRPAPSRAEVEAAVKAVMDASYLDGYHDEHFPGDRTDAARAALLALYREPVPASRTDGAAGEVFEVEMHTTVGLDGWYGANCVWLPESYAPGQRVRVTRVEGEA